LAFCSVIAQILRTAVPALQKQTKIKSTLMVINDSNFSKLSVHLPVINEKNFNKQPTE